MRSAALSFCICFRFCSGKESCRTQKQTSENHISSYLRASYCFLLSFFTFVFYFRFLLLQSKAFHEDRSHRNHFLTFCLRQSPDYWHQKKILILILIRNQCSTRKTGIARGVSDILVGYSRRFFAFLCIITSASVSARKEKRRLLLCIFIILQPIKKLNSWHTHRAV